MEQNAEIGYLDIPQKSRKVFIKGSEETKLYIKKQDPQCSAVIPLSNEEFTIDLICNNQYTDFNQKMHTLDDIKKLDSGEN